MLRPECVDGTLMCNCGGDLCVCGMDGEPCPGCEMCWDDEDDECACFGAGCWRCEPDDITKTEQWQANQSANFAREVLGESY